MTYACEKCGATYDEAEVRRSGTCLVTGEGGGLCMGRVRPVGTLVGGALSGREAYVVGADEARAPDRSATVAVERVRGAVEDYLSGEPSEARQRVRAALPDGLADVLSRCVMRRGPVYPGGEAESVLEFATAEDRAQFANWIVMTGGRLTG